MYPFLILSFFGVVYLVLGKIIKSKIVINTLVLLVAFYFSAVQIRQMWYQFIDIPAYISDQAILSREAGKYNLPYYIDGEDFGPVAVFYSGKHVNKMWEGQLPELFGSSNSFILFTQQWRLDKYHIKPDQYRIIKTDRDKLLVIRT
ncbi:hypothetical protein HY389_00175 [Candidatus Daviesbacteria bacterium]|nr:hypothetical protein [Candidatus Daviesbacteria bacterium]